MVPFLKWELLKDELGTQLLEALSSMSEPY